ncbi:MAG: T9SS type A sorting domain-containing protein, partial [Chitinophagales bacterium]
PAHTYFIISTGDYAQLETVVQIIDASGKIIQEQSVIASDQIIINTTQLSAGIYWVKISNATLQASKALVIEN